jgi:lysine 6-dehydrogenase
MKQKIVVLGAGLVGSTIAADLKQKGHEVTSVDRDENALARLHREYGIRVRKVDIGPATIPDLVRGATLVVGATPGAIGFGVMESVIREGKNTVDISFCPEDYMELDPLAREKGVTVVADMGVAPGMCNAILGYHNRQMKVSSYRCLVGGLPFSREWPLQYKSSWSPMDCIQEYVRPARLRENGEDKVKPAMSDLETVEFERTGPLEAWNSDGLRSLLRSFPDIPDMVEKTLRYPGTVEYLKVLRELGYFRSDPVEVKGLPVRPVDLTASLLFPLLELKEGEGEFTVMQVQIKGTENGQTVRYTYDLYDEYDASTGTLSMARTTGYTATGAAGLILEGLLARKGVIPPEEAAVDQECFKYLMEHLKKRGVEYRIHTDG